MCQIAYNYVYHNYRTYQANKKYLYNMYTMLEKRRRRWADIVYNLCYTNVLRLLGIRIFAMPITKVNVGGSSRSAHITGPTACAAWSTV